MLTRNTAVYHDALRYRRQVDGTCCRLLRRKSAYGRKFSAAVHGFSVRDRVALCIRKRKTAQAHSRSSRGIPRECSCPSNDQLASWQFFGTPDSRYVAPRLHLIFFAAGAKPIDILIAATERRGQRLKRGTRSKGVPIKKKPELCRAGLRFWA